MYCYVGFWLGGTCVAYTARRFEFKKSDKERGSWILKIGNDWSWMGWVPLYGVAGMGIDETLATWMR